MATTDQNTPMAAAQAGGQTGVTAPGYVPQSAYSPLQSAWDDYNKRQDKLPELSRQVQAAYAAADALNKQQDVTDASGAVTGQTPDKSVAPKDQATYARLLQQANNLEQAYYKEQQELGTQASNLAQLALTAQNNAGQLGLDTTKLQEDHDQAARMAGYYQAQAANYNADAAAKQADADYNAALRAGYPADQVAAAKQKADDLANASSAANTKAQELANDAAPGVNAANLAVAQAKAKFAGTNEAAGAATNVANATTAQANAVTAQATAAHSDEAVKASIREAATRGDLNAAQADEILALLDSKKAYSQAQIEGQQAATAQQQLQTHQLQVGDVQTKIEQLGNAVKGGMDPAQADRLMEDYLSGSTPFQRQTQRESQLSGAMNTALSYGMGVIKGQQYLPGAEPGGAYGSTFAKLGVSMPSVPLSDAQPLTQYVAAQGIQTADQPAPRMFDAGGAYTPAQGGATHAPAPVVTSAQILAQDAAQTQPQAPATAAAGGTFLPPEWQPSWTNSPQGDAWLVDQTAGGGGYAPLAPGYAPAYGPYTLPIPAPVSRNAAGGTTPVAAFDPTNPNPSLKDLRAIRAILLTHPAPGETPLVQAVRANWALNSSHEPVFIGAGSASPFGGSPSTAPNPPNEGGLGEFLPTAAAAAGGSFMPQPSAMPQVPRAMQGMLHQPKVTKPPIFARPSSSGRRPMFAGSH